jgi:2-polyprenyl-6-methoxyphenol hydroxylase-like FAD-dependent oxidoreductase
LSPSKKVDDIRVVSDGVVVRCTDGTTEKGSIVVGADGVHSRVRDCMRKLAPRDDASRTGPGDDYTSPFVASFRCMYGNTGKIPGLETGVEWDLHSSGIAMQLFGGPDRAWFLFYEKLPGGATRKRRRYSEEEVAQLAKKFQDVYVTRTLRFKDIWDARKWCMLSDLQEGIVEQWHGERIVLVGDAASKQTPNIGQGWNCGIQDVVVLVNGLRELLERAKGADIGTEDLASVFSTYEETRRPDLVSCFEAAAGATRSTTWGTWPAYLRDRFVFPLTGGNKGIFRGGAGGLMSRGRVLDFIPERNRPVGAIPWVNVPKVEANGAEQDIGK